MNPATIVTCFFDINRAEKGDGRSIDEYLLWIKKTLQLNCNLFVVTEEKFRDFFIEHRPKEYAMHLKIIDFKELHYYKYYDKMREIIESMDYKKKIAHPNRVECVLPEYNIIQYSKFHCLEMAIDVNPFQSEIFFWMDAGCSRFFLDVNIQNSYPGNKTIDFFKSNPNKFIIQKRQDLFSYPIDNNFIWKADNLLYGTMFGGDSNIIKTISKLVENVLVKDMFEKNNVNNEQLALAIIWKNNPDLFFLTENSPYVHLKLFKVLSF